MYWQSFSLDNYHNELVWFQVTRTKRLNKFLDSVCFCGGDEAYQLFFVGLDLENQAFWTFSVKIFCFTLQQCRCRTLSFTGSKSSKIWTLAPIKILIEEMKTLVWISKSKKVNSDEHAVSSTFWVSIRSITNWHSCVWCPSTKKMMLRHWKLT